MNQKRLSFLIVFSAVSIISLIGIQLYWIKLSVETQQQQFSQAVMDAMRNVVQKLEREEAITKVTSSLFKGDELNASFLKDSTIFINKEDLSSSFQKEIFPQNNISPSITKTKNDQLKIKFTPPPREDSSFFIIRSSQKRVLSSTIDYDSSASDPKFADQVKKKATLINGIVNELALISVSQNHSDMISYPKIDSLFSLELALHGIKTDYVFDILDAESNSLSFSENPTESSELFDTPFRIDLFPNDLYIESDHLLLYFPNQEDYVVKHSWKILLISFLLVCILIALFYSSISTIYRQKKLSQVKNDFINNMTHELKTPISTISLACEALGDDSLGLDSERRNAYVGMVKDENKRLSVLVDNVLKSAAWDSAELELNLSNQNLHQIIENVANSFQIQVKNRNGKLLLNLEAPNDEIVADKVHISNVIYNLLDNANKYSLETPDIEIRSFIEDDHLTFSISDKGIGISKENQKKIFDKFFRVSTGNIHNVKGFGLGLNYVKRIIELHQGEISLHSSKGKGTTIIIKLNKYGK